jgi:ribosome maturation factor RimP
MLDDNKPQLSPQDFSTAFLQAADALAHAPEFRGVEIVSAVARQHRQAASLQIIVDRDGGVDVGTCERVAARINATLAPFANAYTLEVVSAGLERALLKPADYERFAGREVKVISTLLIEGAKTHRGRLEGVRGTNVIVSSGTKHLPIPLAAIKSANLAYDVRADLARAKQREKNR